MTSSHLPVLIPVTFIFGSLLTVLLGSLHRSFAHLSATAAAALALYFSVSGLLTVSANGSISYGLAGWMPPLGIEFILDPLSAFFCVLLAGITLLVLIFGYRNVAHESPGKEIPFYSLTMLLLTGLTGMVMTGDLFNLYVFLEISSLAGYALVAIGDKRAPVAAFRYLTMGTAGAAFYLLGVAFIFMTTGSLNMADIAELLPLVEDSRPVIVGLVLIVLGTGLKMALFPMHAWLPDAYTYATSTATALIAPIGTKVAAYILIRIMFFVVNPDYLREGVPLLTVVGYLGATGIIWGSLLAICQKELKRMLAYSSVAQVGYIAVGIGLASPLGFIGAILHALNHACMKCCLFFISGSLRLRLGHSSIPDLTDNLRRTMPWTSAAFAVAAISMIGLPPTAGFFSKWYLALGALEQANWFFLVVLLVSSLLNAVYFFRVLEKIYLKPQAEVEVETTLSGQDTAVLTVAARNEAPLSMLLPTLILAGSLLVLGLFNVWIVTNLIGPMIPSWL